MNGDREYENTVELHYIEITEKEYNERVVRVIKWLLETVCELDETGEQQSDLEAA